MSYSKQCTKTLKSDNIPSHISVQVFGSFSFFLSKYRSSSFCQRFVHSHEFFCETGWFSSKPFSFNFSLSQKLLTYRISSYSFRTCMYCYQRSQYIRLKSKKNIFRGNYMRKYGIDKFGYGNRK